MAAEVSRSETDMETTFGTPSFRLPVLTVEGAKVIADLQWLLDECEDRCLEDTVKWTNEVIAYCPDKWFDDAESGGLLPERSRKRIKAEGRMLELGRTLIRCREFERARYHLKPAKRCATHKHAFLYYWAQYLGITKIRLETEAEAFDRKAQNLTVDDDVLALLALELCKLKKTGQMDAFLLFLLGRVQKDLGQFADATRNLTEAVKLEPRLWPAWEILALVIQSAEEVNTVREAAQGAWMADWFVVDALRRFCLYRNVTESVDRIMEAGFSLQPALLTAKAVAYNQMWEHDVALECFAELRRLEPQRIEAMEVYSDSLFVRHQRTELADLAHRFFRTHRFHWETCCVVANYYGTRRDHEQAIKFLQRALKLNPNTVAPWTLIGHEFMELKNNSSACLAYRRAIEIDPKDYRGWYGLGQLYEILKMHTYSLYYYKQAHLCKPDDSRLLVALGEVYMKLTRHFDAQRCFLNAFKVGDVEGSALMNLARLYALDQDFDGAAQVYEKYLVTYCPPDTSEDENAAECAKFLAKHLFEKGDIRGAEMHAQRCLNHERSREEGRTVLRKISEKLADDQKQAKLNESSASMEVAGSDEDEDAELSFE